MSLRSAVNSLYRVLTCTSQIRGYTFPVSERISVKEAISNRKKIPRTKILNRFEIALDRVDSKKRNLFSVIQMWRNMINTLFNKKET